MLKKAFFGLLLIAVTISTVFIPGCDTAGKSGTLIGAGAGALAGQAIGGNTTGTLIGAGVGAVGGYIVGNEMDKSNAQKQQQITAPQQQTYNAPASEANTVTVWVNNSNGSQTAVKLTRKGDGSYTGPKGERYQAMPTEQQLKQAYGM
jgi:osmotically inducible lipoprotein OsmB